MPFVTEIFRITEPTPAFIAIQRIFDCSNKEAQKIIDKGRVKHLDGRMIYKSEKICGDIAIEYFKAQGKIYPFFIHQDFALFNKPHQLLTHPKGRFDHPSLCDSIKAIFGREANPVHRLDYETSGILLVSRNKKSEVELKKLFEESKINKTYIALVEGIVYESKMIDLPILSPSKIQKNQNLGIRSQISNQGKKALTYIRVLAHFKNQTLLEVSPLTGRTHQIRLHLSAIGYPIVNEPLYQEDQNAQEYLKDKLFKNDHQPLCLHARKLEFSYQKKDFKFQTPKLPEWSREFSEIL